MSKNTGGAPGLSIISAKFSKKIEMSLMLYLGAWGKMIHEKNLKQKSRDNVPTIYILAVLAERAETMHSFKVLVSRSLMYFHFYSNFCISFE